MTQSSSPSPLEPLKIACTTADCDNELHCFRSTKKLRAAGLGGACRECHVQLVDWDRVHERRLDDVDHTFEELRREFIRHHFWHIEFDETAHNHALRKGRKRLQEAAGRRIARSVALAQPAYDGRQTPFKDNVIYYAQHAVAACCRTCIEYWHGIPKGRALTQEEELYLLGLVSRYIDDRLPALPDEPTHVPPRRRPPGQDT